MKQLGLLCLLALGACTSDSIDSNEQARRAHLGLDPSVQESILLGFDGFNAASSANIDPQMAPGTAAGMLTITGQVDQGSSANKGMRLHVGMVSYSDGKITVDSHLTIAGQLADGGSGTVVRAPGSTTIMGTAVQGDGTYDVDVTL